MNGELARVVDDLVRERTAAGWPPSADAGRFAAPCRHHRLKEPIMPPFAPRPRYIAPHSHRLSCGNSVLRGQVPEDRLQSDSARG